MSACGSDQGQNGQNGGAHSRKGDSRVPAPSIGNRVTVVLGAQWGDEGKGKVVDLLAQDADIVCRCQVRLTFPTHSLPSSLTHVCVPPTYFICIDLSSIFIITIIFVYLHYQETNNPCN